MAQTRVGKVVQVTWEDAWSNDIGYWTVETVEKEKPLILTVYGYVLRDNKDGITVAREAGDQRFRGVQHIPAGMVRNVQILR